MKEIIPAIDGREIHLRCWFPEQEFSTAVVVSHGMGEHVERYSNLANALCKRGIAVLGANHRGHGPESQKLGHFADENGWQLVLSDLDSVIEHTRTRYRANVILVGHSMGSFIARHYAALNGKKLSGLVLCGSDHQGPALFRAGMLAAKAERFRIGRSTPSKLLEWLTFGDFNKKFKPLRTDQDWLSRDEAMVDAYLADKHCGFTCTPQFWVDFLGGLAEIARGTTFGKIPPRLPVWVISGDADPVSRYGKGWQALAEALSEGGVRSVSKKLYPGARHELFNETNREEVFEDLINWMHKYCTTSD